MRELISNMFGGIGFTWRREPVLYLTLITAAAGIVGDFAAGALDLETAIVAGVELLVGFFLRGQVSPAR